MIWKHLKCGYKVKAQISFMWVPGHFFFVVRKTPRSITPLTQKLATEFDAQGNYAIFLLEVKIEIESCRSFHNVSVKRNPG